MKFRDHINLLETEELERVQRDLSTGGHHLKSLIDVTLRERFTSPRRVCATCGNPIPSEHSGVFGLTFGPTDLRKKASFCAPDCLEYFLTQLKTTRKD